MLSYKGGWSGGQVLLTLSLLFFGRKQLYGGVEVLVQAAVGNPLAASGELGYSGDCHVVRLCCVSIALYILSLLLLNLFGFFFTVPLNCYYPSPIVLPFVS